MNPHIPLSSRRRFLRTSIAAAGAAFAGPNIVRAETLGNANKDGANSRIGLGFIGLGLIARGHVASFPGYKEVQPIAVCDVRDGNVATALANLKEAGHNDVVGTGLFEEVINNPAVDAVVVMTPDHWHAGISLAAMKAGKDVYVEKPMCLTVEESKLMVEAQKKYDRILQVGSQQRSTIYFRMAVNLIRNGMIGEVKEAYAALGDFPPPKGKPRSLKDVVLQPPPGFNYDRWLGPTPYYEYLKDRVMGNFNAGWRCYWDYGSRKFGDWGAHHFDIIQWALDRDDSGPVEFIPKGFEGAEFHHYRYENGFTVWRDKEPNPMMIRFIGSEGEINVSRDGIKTSPNADLVRHKFTANDKLVYESKDHRKNFLESIKTRQPTICPATIGHRSGTICYLSAIAERTAKPLKWDPKTEQVIDNPEATAELSRPRRKGYEFPVI